MVSITSLVRYVLLIFAVYTTGSIYSIYFYYSSIVTLLFIGSGLLYFFGQNARNAIKSRDVVTILLLSLWTMVVFVIRDINNATPYIAILMQIITACFITHYISYEEFKKKYIGIICFFAVTSLVCYLITLIAPSFMLNFPYTEGPGSVNYYNAIIHVFQSGKGYAGHVAVTRNAGIFWEPGAYQAFLNLGLAFLFAEKEVKKRNIKIIVLIIAIISTSSTTGYLVMFLLCFAYRKQLTGLFRGRDSLITGAAIAAGLFFVAYSSKLNPFSAIAKISNEFSDGGFLDRLFLDDLAIFFQAPLNFLGISFEAYEAMKRSSGNAIVQTAVTMGIPFTAMLLKMYYNYAKLSEKKWLTIIILICFFSTESLLWRPIFLCLAWYGAQGQKRRRWLRIY